MNEHKYRHRRSRSPTAVDAHRRRRSPDRHGRQHSSKSPASGILPNNARTLTKHDLTVYKPMFALYLDIQKDLDIEELEENEIKGRWKSFVNKWNRGELAEGWYDPATLAKAAISSKNHRTSSPGQQEHVPGLDSHVTDTSYNENRGGDEEDDDGYGPSLPQSAIQLSMIPADTSRARLGPTIPNMQDLQSRNEDDRQAAQTAWSTQRENEHYERKQERKFQRERLEDLVPRAAAGTRERQIEKKKDLAASNRAFAASKDADAAEVQDSDLMGEDTMSELKKLKKEQERRKTEREIRREEMLRARTAEREERVRHMREKEDKTMSMLREIARERFGDGNMQPASLKSE